jgi:hypothetical protein
VLLNHFTIVQLLVQHGAQVTIMNNINKKPTDYIKSEEMKIAIDNECKKYKEKCLLLKLLGKYRTKTQYNLHINTANLDVSFKFVTL